MVDEDRIWFKSTHGIEVEQIGRDPGLCASAIIRDVPHVVTDAATDPRTLNNPLVRGELGLRFYVGIPLTTGDGYRLGTLNVIDVEPREVSDEELATLHDLAAVVMDELELRLMARKQVELEAARENARFRDTLLAGLSHDMRTPLAVLQALAILEDDETSELGVERRRTMMRRHVRHLEWLIKQFLDFASLEADRRPSIRITDVDIAGVVADAVDVFSDAASIDVEVEDRLPSASADRDRTLQIVLELLNNAIRFGPTDATVTVRATSADGEVRVEIEDHGPGVNPGEVEHVFEKFHRGSGSRGSGIGLYVVRSLAEAQGSRIEVDSTSGEGSRFTLVLQEFATS